MAERGWRPGDFELLGKCGEGKMAKVYKARERRSGRLVALKVFRKRPLEQYNFVHQARREVELQYHLHYRHIVKLFGYFDDEDSLYLVLEFAGGGSLFARTAAAPLPAARVRDVSRQLALALQYMHLREVVHRDLKLENVLLDEEGAVKVADFGWAVHCPRASQRETYCGTVVYLAPEMVARAGYDKAVDIWAFGVLLYELSFGRPPFLGADRAATAERIRAQPVAFPPDADPALADLVALCLAKEPARRPTAGGLLAHRYHCAEA